MLTGVSAIAFCQVAPWGSQLGHVGVRWGERTDGIYLLFGEVAHCLYGPGGGGGGTFLFVWWMWLGSVSFYSPLLNQFSIAARLVCSFCEAMVVSLMRNNGGSDWRGVFCAVGVVSSTRYVVRGKNTVKEIVYVFYTSNKAASQIGKQC
jgi:hypothetical protein